ncbi:hypothetical protein, partial [Dorea sp. 210702-DFI.3.17]|uniref:hypothetical protein n=1 Tax=Dorea sp. 210702-DFI.3.17 TaxID=2883208 RepID=UPI001D08CD68
GAKFMPKNKVFGQAEGGNILIEELEDIKAEMPQEYRRNLLRSTDWYLVDYQARGKRTGNGGRCKYA